LAQILLDRNTIHIRKEDLMVMFKSILHPTDFSPEAEHAFQLACSLACAHGGRVLVLYVQEQSPGVYASGFATAPPPPPLSEADMQKLRDQLQQMQPEDSAVAVQHLLKIGDPAAVILDTAVDNACDVIVMGTHGRSGVRRWLMGSVAEKVMRGAACPVLTIKSAGPVGPARPLGEEVLGALKTPHA
jgi:nucleotide-binding universal stress UspA family protein